MNKIIYHVGLDVHKDSIHSYKGQSVYRQVHHFQREDGGFHQVSAAEIRPLAPNEVHHARALDALAR